MKILKPSFSATCSRGIFHSPLELRHNFVCLLDVRGSLRPRIAVMVMCGWGAVQCGPWPCRTWHRFSLACSSASFGVLDLAVVHSLHSADGAGILLLSRLRVHTRVTTGAPGIARRHKPSIRIRPRSTFPFSRWAIWRTPLLADISVSPQIVPTSMIRSGRNVVSARL